MLKTLIRGALVAAEVLISVKPGLSQVQSETVHEVRCMRPKGLIQAADGEFYGFTLHHQFVADLGWSALRHGLRRSKSKLLVPRRVRHVHRAGVGPRGG